MLLSKFFNNEETMNKQDTLILLFWIIFYKWLSELRAIEKEGNKICPLLLKELGRFAPHICACDIPKTRVIRDLFATNFEKCCHKKGRCLPRLASCDHVYEECNPKRIFYESVHLFQEEELLEFSQKQLSLPFK